MKDFNLENIKIHPIDTPRHQEELRRILLTSSHWDRKPSLLSNMVFYLKGGEKYMNIKRFAFAGLVVAVLVAGAFALTGNKFGGSTAYAKELVQKSIQVTTSLPPGEKQMLGVITNDESILKEAYNAKDLVVLTYDQVKDQLPDESGPHTVVQNGGSGQGLDQKLDQGTGSEQKFVTQENFPQGGSPKDALAKLQQLKFLQFTNSQGAKVIIGLNQENLPVFTTVRFGK